jgi:hypothetical protein
VQQFRRRAGLLVGEPRRRGVAAPENQTIRELNMNRRLSGVALATAAALAFSTVAVTSALAEDAKVKCEGVNSCKGTSACATASSGCAGQNSCKGQGYLELTKAECDAARAKLEKEKAGA